MSERDDGEEGVRSRYETLIDRGVYADFAHPAAEHAFVGDILGPIVGRLEANASVLDVGCGPGEWLAEVSRMRDERAGAINLHGFDLTPGMIDVAAKRLAAIGPPPVRLQVGSMFDDAAYRFDPGHDGTFDLVYAFDVVQQLPPGRQVAGVDRLLAAVRPSGTLVVFDHDRDSAYGRRMGLRKLITRYTGIPLVPRFYTETRYPPLASIARRLAARSGADVRIETRPVTRKRALVVARIADDQIAQ